QAYTQSLALLTDYSTELSQNSQLYQAYEAIYHSDAFARLSQAQQQTIRHALRDFRLGGVALSGEDKKRFADIQKRLSELSTQFSNNLLDATQAWYKHLEDAKALAGLPESALAQAAQAAERKGLKGYLV